MRRDAGRSDVRTRLVSIWWTAAITLGACSPSVPSAAPATPLQTEAVIASSAPTPAPLPSPSIACDSPPTIEGLNAPVPGCDRAVTAALAALPAAHPAVMSISFRYGHYCPPGYYCALQLPPAAHVIVTHIDGSQMLISVLGHESGNVTVTEIEPIASDAPARGE